MTAPAGRLPAGVEPGGRVGEWSVPRPRYVVCDVDGTLVGRQGAATDGVVDAVARAQQAGVRVGFATGRMRGAVERLWRQLGAQGPHILHNGAEVRAEGRTVACWDLDAAQVDGLVEVAAAHNDGYVEIYTEDAYVVTSWDERARPHWELLGSDPEQVIASASDLAGATALKATFAVFDPQRVATVERAITEVGLLPGSASSPLTPHVTYVNATDPQADKGRALVHAAAELDVGMEATVAVGDATNDLSMLARVGTAIAMGQAPTAVREAAHLVVPDVEADGVAVALDAVVGWYLAATEAAG